VIKAILPISKEFPMRILALAILTSILFGVAPAWIAARVEPADALRGARTTATGTSLLQRGLVVFQAALSLVLLVFFAGMAHVRRVSWPAVVLSLFALSSAAGLTASARLNGDGPPAATRGTVPRLDVAITVDAGRSLGPLPRAWRFFGADEPNYAYLPDGRRLIEQLKVGGRLVMPLGSTPAAQQLTVVEKITPSETRTRSMIPVVFVPFTRSRD
jgi:hypothetical protein